METTKKTSSKKKIIDDMVDMAFSPSEHTYKI